MKKILLVDDDADVRRMIADLLRTEFEVIEARDGLEGLTCLAREHPDLAIVDLDMPFMGGLELLNAYRKLRGGTVFIMLTASHDSDSAVAALSAGAVSFMTKPWEPQSLRAEVKRLLAPAQRLNPTGAPWRIENG